MKINFNNNKLYFRATKILKFYIYNIFLFIYNHCKNKKNSFRIQSLNNADYIKLL